MVKAVFLDFYGTVVHEDGEVVTEISKRIMDTGVANNIHEVGSYWYKSFLSFLANSYGGTFETQREIERKSLSNTIQHFKSSENADALCDYMFANWIKPTAFEEAKEFFDRCSLPVFIVSNIDRADIGEAISYHGFKPKQIFTSEDAQSYKPRKELFELALNSTGFNPEEVVHIGDSLVSDIKGASSLGINTIWINRSNKEIPGGVVAVNSLLQVFETNYFVQ